MDAPPELGQSLSLLRLPPEIQVDILLSLDVKDLSACKQVCVPTEFL